MKTNNKILSLLLISLLTFGILGCKTSNALKGGAIGGAAGGVLGGLLSKNNTATGVIVGAAIGGSAGAIIGREMDKQAEELERELKQAEVERVGEGIKVTFDSGLLFDVNKSSLNTMAKTNLDSLAKTLNKYPETEIVIDGHTDDTGAEKYNMKLSLERANTVQDYLQNKGVNNSRIVTRGFGESLPKSDNMTDAGRSENRRVEIGIVANEKMQEEAKKAEGGSIQP
ncbi:OmpA family protein [Algoriphagus boritolerans]|uniref:Outer membrane protein OmpA n=1 Tax=Algoriphagus boritolerans DSM 17298 = JCM 18970 TaxID=1120964 RepID=A0A1H5X6H1_9BACT|nr:OmpA family protein [Algoriphagus boritolerans]SEG06980.1 Outer membrane protein OmpA [Algoriphagus boritolerans DSM 17298 = JCM 18970]